ncbi:hypothetical protein B296_00029199 [Ensete ventricosum]|uniref:Uncharacterized protein n=1 Tax=Ensete ventricosum TaxID=4639 RepID=A0A426XC91_ENSVE|nr:hypothetical protein B296_00029199 [Ensete ventricosum]
MLRPGVTQEWVDEGELPRERTKNQRWQRPYDVITGSSTLVYDTTRRRAIDLRSECHGMIRAVGELDCFSAHIRLREPDKSKDKVETARRTQWCQSRWLKGVRKRRRV